MVSSLLFDRHAVVASERLVETLEEVLRSENVIDVQFVEALSGPIGASLGFMESELADRVEVRLAAMDKMVLSRRFNASGIRVPAILPMSDVSPETLAETLGFPVVLKARVGSSGDQISIVRDLRTLNRMVATWEEPDQYFYEQYIDGQKYNYGAAVGAAGIEQELTYRVSAWRRPTGSASQIETVSDPPLAALGRRALDVVGCSGLVNIDIIRDRTGVDWLIDFNARAFGGSASFLCAGLDISEGYLRAIGQTTSPPVRRIAPAGVSILIFPTCLGEVIASGSMALSAVAFWRESRRYLRWLGPRYWLVEALVTVYQVADAAREARST